MTYARDAAVLAGTAILTALLVAPILGPGFARAQDEPSLFRGLVANPTLEASGVTFALKPAKTAYAAEEEPDLILTASAGKSAAKAEITVRLRTTAPSSPMARMVSMPVEAFTKTIPVSLKAGESKTIRIESGVALAAGSTFMVELQSGKQRLSSSSYAVPAPTVDIPAAFPYTPKVAVEVPKATR